MIGTFHLICAYFRILGKKINGSGLSDVFLEAGLIGSGSIHGVLSGKHYDRALNCHKTMLESLERLLLEQYLLKNSQTEQETELEIPLETVGKLKDFVQSISQEP